MTSLKSHRSQTMMAFSLATLLTAFSAAAQPLPPNNSWLDRKLVNWNKSSSDFPRLPGPSAAANLNQCQGSFRAPTSDGERALARRGWKLFGPVQTASMTQIVMAASGFDGMCRPMGYQAFVYVEGRYAGTLSPNLMDSRTDGALITARLTKPTHISAEFVRYSESDALCCPSKTSVVTYRIRPDESPDLVPIAALTRPNQTTNPTDAESTNSTNQLFGHRWILSALGNQSFHSSEPYIEFENQKRRFAGSSGCNRFTGSFERLGTALKFSPIASTRRACLDVRAQRTETKFLSALESVTRFEIQSNTLRLYAKERLVMKLRK